MKFLRCLFFILASTSVLKAQILEKIYTDEHGYEIDISEATEIAYYNFKTEDQKEYTMRKYDFDEVLLRGIYRKRYLKGGERMFSGVDTFFFKNGHINYIIHYHDSKQNGELLSFYDNGKLRRKEYYQYDSLLSSSCYTIAGDDTACFPFRVNPEYPGGENERKAFIKNNVNYPTEALEDDIEGSVIISFIVQEDGSYSSFRVIKSPHPILSQEALRVAQMMPKWKPGLLDGEPAKMLMNMPVKFRIEQTKPKKKK